ncbi:MAG TPA: hypothetical protein VF407_01215, partial [Polyangiaceae bacterium]
LSVVPAVTVAIFLLKPPHSNLVPIRIEYAAGIYATLVVSIVATLASLRLGGPLDDIPVVRGSSHGHTLH